MSEAITIEELERRMRPGQYSQGGFLGPSESLEAVMARDKQTLVHIGINHEQIASALESILEKVRELEKNLPIKEQLQRDTDFPNFYRPEKNPRFSKENLPELNIGYLIDSLQIFILQWRGFQDCPWGCADAGSFDFMVLNRKTGESFSAPALIIHLIRAHHFFEGVGSPYRVDPEKIVRTLDMH